VGLAEWVLHPMQREMHMCMAYFQVFEERDANTHGPCPVHHGGLEKLLLLPQQTTDGNLQVLETNVRQTTSK